MGVGATEMESMIGKNFGPFLHFLRLFKDFKALCIFSTFPQILINFINRIAFQDSAFRFKSCQIKKRKFAESVTIFIGLNFCTLHLK